MGQEVRRELGGVFCCDTKWRAGKAYQHLGPWARQPPWAEHLLLQKNIIVRNFVQAFMYPSCNGTFIGNAKKHAAWLSLTISCTTEAPDLNIFLPLHLTMLGLV